MDMKQSDYKFGFYDNIKAQYKSKKGLSQNIVREISERKNEPEWMRETRFKALEIFYSKKMPSFGPDLSELDFDNLYYYSKASENQAGSWKNVPKEIKKTFDRIGVPEAEKKFLAGLGAQYDSEVVYQSISKMLSKKGVIFCDTDTALKKYPEILKKYFGTVVPVFDNKFSALNTAVWSGGSFIYVPKNVKVELPLQAYFRINAKNLGQFERTLIIADEGSFVHYTEGCTAPIYDTNMLHAAVVEIIVKKGACVRYSTVQNWSKNVYNLVTKRMFVEEEGEGIWVDANIGSKATMKYPSIYLKGPKAKGTILSLAIAGKDQHQDSGAKAIHLASETSSIINSKSISKDGGKNTFRGLVKVVKGVKNCKSKMSCHSLLLDDKSQANSFPIIDVFDTSSKVSHETTVSSIEENQLFYLRSRGISKKEAESLIVNGFAEPIIKELPLEYSVELNRLIQMEMDTREL
ncbi:MAG: Fe-S cluster assembly protein SufB [Candidatus Levybacteria bacterium]|nr:Fe-S cluster assembly protein SufB [Candidatus Levybacteria bacterium]